MMKRLLFLLVLALMTVGAQAQVLDVEDVEDTVYTVHSIDQRQFWQLVGNWDLEDWTPRNERPVVVDFCAKWCRPCRLLEPILSDLAQYYHGDVDFYLIDVDQNPDIVSAFEIRSIPYVLMCPLQGKPQAVIGYKPQQEYTRIINQMISQ